MIEKLHGIIINKNQTNFVYNNKDIVTYSLQKRNDYFTFTSSLSLWQSFLPPPLRIS